jgi:hypothetical protein
MRVEAVSLCLSEPQLRAVVTDDGGFRRAIEYRWWRAEDTVVPPESWVSALQGECEYQRAEELAAARGQSVPG